MFGYRLHHIGIIVHDLDAAIARYIALGFGEPKRFRIDEQDVEAATFPAGPGYVELISPTVTEGGLIRYLDSRGESIHHVAYQVDDIHAAIEHVSAAGFEMIDAEPRRGVHDWLVAFIHPKSCHGVLTELVQVPDREG